MLYDIEDRRFGTGRFVCPVGVLFVELDRLRPFDEGLGGGGNLEDVADEGEDNADAWSCSGLGPDESVRGLRPDALELVLGSPRAGAATDGLLIGTILALLAALCRMWV